jgi:uncharacterized CHY-type Zn-finger protein
MEKTMRIFVKPERKSVPVRCSECNKLIRITKTKINEAPTAIKYSLCKDCREAAKSTKKATKPAPSPEEMIQSAAKLLKVPVKCGRCRKVFEISEKERRLKRSHLCPECMSKLS